MEINKIYNENCLDTMLSMPDNFTGFRFSGVMRKNDVTNYPIQSAAFHILLYTFIILDKEMQERDLKTRLIGQIHDSLILDIVPNELKKVVSIMKRIVEDLPKHFEWICVPMNVEMEICEVDEPWNEKKSYKF